MVYVRFCRIPGLRSFSKNVVSGLPKTWFEGLVWFLGLLVYIAGSVVSIPRYKICLILDGILLVFLVRKEGVEVTAMPQRRYQNMKHRMKQIMSVRK